MAKVKQRHPDPAEAEWRAAYQRGLDDPEPQPVPSLPTWTPAVPVERPILGRYLHDRDTNVVHDVEHATAACDLDGIANGTFVHFLSEVEVHLPGAIDHDCMRP